MQRANRAAFAFMILGAFALGACGSRGSEGAANIDEGSTGSVQLELTVGGASLATMSYTVSGPSDFSRTGTVDLRSASGLSFTLAGIPAGQGYRIALGGTTSEGATQCQGSATFGVTGGITTQVGVPIACHAPGSAGGVLLGGTINVCPVLDGIATKGNSLALGAKTVIEVLAHDSDAAPAALTYRWAASAGALKGSSGSSSVFTCTRPGESSIAVAVSDGDTACDASGSVTIECGVDASSTFFTTKTPYAPRADASTYEAPPTGFSPVFTELVARHGSRGLSSVKYDAAALAMWQRASDDGALTALGATLGADIRALMKANALLGFGVAGIGTPGYGNLTAVGIAEHQQLAVRLVGRLPAYFAELASNVTSPRSIAVVTSGVDRAVDSSGFFVQSLTGRVPALSSLVTYPPAPSGYPAGAPVLQPAGTNRFQLYFHKLAAKTDLVTSPADPYFQTYQNSLAFQSYQSNSDLVSKVNAILGSSAATDASRVVLEGLFSKEFVDKIANKLYSFTNAGTFSFTSEDGRYSATVTGDGKTQVKTLADAASMLYNLYVVTPAMQNEAPVDFGRYLPVAQARELAYLQDAQDFYQMGPGLAETTPVTYAMAQSLEDDFFNEVDAIARGDLSRGAKLRFTHAEIIVPFASLLGLRDVYVPVAKADTYAYESNPWRGELVAPMAANIQWDIYRDAAGTVLVKMLYNEEEKDFQAACDTARYAAGSSYYEYSKLKACYSHVATN